MNNHKLKVNLPLFPGTSDPNDVLIEMNGKEIPMVSGITIRASANGFTNAVIEIPCDVAITMAAAVFIDFADGPSEALVDKLASAYEHVQAEIDRDLEREGDSIENNRYAKADFVKQLIKKLIEGSNESE